MVISGDKKDPKAVYKQCRANKKGKNRTDNWFRILLTFFYKEVWDLLVTRTNLNAERKRADGTEGGDWKNLTLQGIKAFFGLNIAMGVVKLPEARMYWQQRWLTNVPSFCQVMARNCFFQILRYLHVSDDVNVVPVGMPGHDKLHKIKPLSSLLFPKFECTYELHKNICVDECMIPWRGRLSLQQFIANKSI